MSVKSINSTKHFLLWTHICHLLLVFTILFLLQTQSSSMAADSAPEDNFFNKTIDQITPGETFNAKGKPPLDSFEIFQKKSPELVIWVTFWQYQTYRYPLFVQVEKNIITDVYLAFPSFFLHDKIHQLMILKWGPQNFHRQANLSAIYRWDKLKQSNSTAIYEANCSITCFPVSLAIQSNILGAKITPLWQQFHQVGITKSNKKK